MFIRSSNTDDEEELGDSEEESDFSDYSSCNDSEEEVIQIHK